ncbi:unnamed protein product [Moneuplotes crassus]|uniref:Uncharacterized protein n=1 Tax=Euplotes crassus TaxID=5936 RepID=A0AAD1UKL5_EUPCR|nr:unnamed protein product [Moneuplotes crassus]
MFYFALTENKSNCTHSSFWKFILSKLVIFKTLILMYLLTQKSQFFRNSVAAHIMRLSLLSRALGGQVILEAQICSFSDCSRIICTMIVIARN